MTGTAAAARIVERAKRDRRGVLVFTIGTGCCESTAPFLYEDFWPGPDSEAVGEIAGVTVFAPEYLRALYPGDDGVVVDVDRDGVRMPVHPARSRRRSDRPPNAASL